MDLEKITADNRKYAFIVYILQSLAFIGLLFTPIMGLIINYIKDDDVRGTLVESHFSWQKRTFWFAVIWYVIGYLTFPVIGWLVIFIASVWYFYRIAKGWIYLVDGKELSP